MIAVKKIDAFVLLAIIVSIVAFNIEQIAPEYKRVIFCGKTVKLYYTGMAIFIIMICYTLYRVKNRFITYVLFWLSISNLSDELFFNPLKLQLNELVSFVGIITIGSWKYFGVVIHGIWKRLVKACTYGYFRYRRRWFKNDRRE